MNTERLLREVEKRLVGLPETHRNEILDAVREEIARERRRVDPADTVELERERRLEAETLREVLEAINRHAALDETIGEVLKQLSRIVVFDSCSLALLEPDGGFRIAAVRGFPEPSQIVGQVFRCPISDELRETRWPASVADVQEDERFSGMPGIERVRSWAGLPLLVEGEILGILSLDRHRIEVFDEEDLHRAKAVAFSAAAVVRRAQLHEYIRRYAALMERVVAVDHAVFSGAPVQQVAETILAGALRIGDHPGGILVLAPAGQAEARIAAASGVFEKAMGRTVPAPLLEWDARRLSPEEVKVVAKALGVRLGGDQVLLVPLATPDHFVGGLALLSPGEDGLLATLLESYASRAAIAYTYTTSAPR